MSEIPPTHNGDVNVGSGKKDQPVFAWGVQYWKLVVIVIFGLAIAAQGLLFATGYLTYGNPSAPEQEYTAVCDGAAIDTYNDAMYYQVREGSSEPTIDEAGVKNLKQQIESKSGYKGDPTCQAILFWTAVYFNDAASARTAYDIYLGLYNERIFPDPNLRGNNPLIVYEDTLAGLEATAVEEPLQQ